MIIKNKYSGSFYKAERELYIPTHEPDTDNAGVGIFNVFLKIILLR